MGSLCFSQAHTVLSSEGSLPTDMSQMIRKEKKRNKSREKPNPLYSSKRAPQLVVTYGEKIKDLISSDSSLDIRRFKHALDGIRQDGQNEYVTGANNGHAGAAAQDLINEYIDIWKDIINYTFEIKVEDSTRGFRTSLMNLLLRQDKCTDKSEKFRYLLQNGASKNLNPAITFGYAIDSQREYPLYIIFYEMSRDERPVFLDIIIKEKLGLKKQYSQDDSAKLDIENYNPDEAFENQNSEDDEGVYNLSINQTLDQNEGNNKHILLKKLIDENDFESFKKIIECSESEQRYLYQAYDNKTEQIEDQLHSPALEYILSKMHECRGRAIARDHNQNDVDYIDKFLEALPGLEKQWNIDQSNALRKLEVIIPKLETDYENFFEAFQEQIDNSKAESQKKGEALQDSESFKDLLIEWLNYSKFRNHLLVNANHYALESANSQNSSDFIKLVRYLNTNTQSLNTGVDAAVFREIAPLGGLELVLKTPNRLGWTPIMYSAFRKQTKVVIMYINLTHYKISTPDGLGNNILHLLFPLPEKFFLHKADGLNQNVYELVGPEDIAKKDLEEKTTDIIRTILKDGRMDREDLVRALNSVSIPGYTPVSLAAKMGFYEVYDIMVDFLKSQSEWVEDNHSYAGEPINTLFIEGLEDYKHRKSAESDTQEGSLSDSELEEIDQRITAEKRKLEEIDRLSNKIGMYDRGNRTSVEIYDFLADYISSYFNKLDTTTARKRADANIYMGAMHELVAAIKSPPAKKVKVQGKVWSDKIPHEETYSQPIYKDKRRFPVFGRYQKVQVGEKEMTRQVFKSGYVPGLVDGEVYPTKGLQYTRPLTKITYLRPLVLDIIVERYLRDTQYPVKFKFDDFYKQITGHSSRTYFERAFGQKVEKEMQIALKKKLKDLGRLKEENRFNANRNEFDNLTAFKQAGGLYDSFDEDDASVDEGESSDDASTWSDED